MPKRRRATTKRGRRVGRRGKRRKTSLYRRALRKRRSRPTTTRIRQVGVSIPDRVRVKLVYTQLTLMSSTTGSIVDQIFSLNSPFDPDFSGTGTQPLLYDQWAAWYGYYRCFGSSIRITAVNNSSLANAQPTDVCLVPSAASTSFNASDADTIQQQPYARRRTFYTRTTLKSYMGSSKIWGEKRQRIMVDSQYEAAVTTNPAIRSYWHLCYWPTNRSSSQTGYIEVRIVYYVEFSQRARFSAS